MRTIRENRDDAALQKVDKEHRFLWVITTRYHKAKKAGGVTAEFWEGLLSALPQFETPATPSPVWQPTSPPPTRPRPKTPPATPPSSVGRPTSPPPIRPTDECRRPRPMKKATKHSAKDQMIVKDEEEEEEEDNEDNEEKEVEEEEEKENEEEKEEEEEEGKRGEGIRGKSEDDRWEGKDEIEVDMPVHHRRKADINRQLPQPSKKPCRIPCWWCDRTGKECVNQAQGFACWPCAKAKAKCEPGSERKAAGTRRPARTKKAPVPDKMVEVSRVQPDRAKSKVEPRRQVPVPVPVLGPKPRCRLVKSTVYVFDSDEESKEEKKAGPSRLAPAQESKAGPSRLAPAKKESLFGSDEESEPIARKEKGNGKAGK
jgi:hypothetical protein